MVIKLSEPSLKFDEIYQALLCYEVKQNVYKIRFKCVYYLKDYFALSEGQIEREK